MFCDGVANLEANERSRYADLLVIIAAADGELVREEIQVLEGLMGRAMVHPEARTSRLLEAEKCDVCEPLLAPEHS